MTRTRLSIFSAGIFVLLLFFFLVVPSTAAPPFSGLEVVSSEGTSGSIARVPLVLSGVAEPISELDVSLAYNPSFLTVVDVVKGNALTNATLELVIDRGLLRLTITSPDGFTDGTLAAVRFNVLSSSGLSPLRITHLTAKSGRTLSPLFLSQKEGTLSIIPGLGFSTSSAGQRIAVERTLAGERVVISGDTLTFTRDGMEFTCRTDGLAEGDGRVTGIVKEVTVSSSSSLNLSAGPATTSFTFTTPSYMSEGRFTATLDTTVSTPVLTTIRPAAERAGLNLSTVLFTARPLPEGFGSITLLTAVFTLPAAVIPAGSNETLHIASLKDDGTVDITRPDLTIGAGQETLSLTIPGQPAYPTLGIILARQVARPPVTPPPHTTGDTIFSEGGEAASKSLWTGMFLIFFLVAVVVIGVFYVHRKRGG